MKLWHILVLLAILVVAALLIAIIWGWTTAPFYLLGVLVLLLGIFLLNQGIRVAASGLSYREFVHMNMQNATYYTALDPEQRDQAKRKKKGEEELPPLHFQEKKI